MNKKLQLLLLLLSILMLANTYAQTAKLDSLEYLLKTHKTEDTIKVRLLNAIVRNVYKSNVDKALDYADKAIELSEKLKFKKGKAESFYLIGSSLSYNKSDKLALDYYLQALKIAEEINSKHRIASILIACGIKYAAIGNISEAKECYARAMKIGEELNNQNMVVTSLINLSVIYTGEGDYEKALEGYEKSVQILKNFDNQRMLSTVLNNIGEINKYQGNYPQALEFYHEALKINEDINNESAISTIFLCIGTIGTLQGDFQNAFEYVNRALKIAEKLNNKRRIMLCYEEIGNIYLQENKSEALDYLQKALKIAEEFSYQTPILNISIKIGDFYCNQDNYEEALKNYSRALIISENLKRKRTISETCIRISALYIFQKEYGKALKYSHRSLELANELKLVNQQSEVHGQLSEIYAATSDYQRAYQHHEKYKELNDRIFNEKNIKKLTELEYSYKFEKEKLAIELEQQKKDLIQIAKEKQDHIIIISLIAGGILMSLLTLYIFRSNRIKRKSNIILAKQNDEIEKLNEEYLAVNEELMVTNKALVEAKMMVEESEEKLHLLIKNSNDILVLVNEKGEQTFISDAAKNLTGYDVEDLLGLVDDVIFPEDIDIVRQHWGRVLADKDILDTVQYRHKHKENGYVWFEAVAQNFLDHPAIKSVVANVRDITKRKMIEQALQESEAAKERFLKNEIERINQELESNQKSMTAATLKLIQNAEYDAQIINRLVEIEALTNTEGNQKIQALISDNKRLSYSSNWDEFEILFEKVHRSFYKKLNTQFPNLTPNERKICAFLKLNMSNKDIAKITFQSDDALKKARLRLRQKLEIGRETNLTTFLQNI